MPAAPFFAWVLLMLAACAPQREVRMEIDAVLEKHEDKLMAIPGVEGIGVGGTKSKPVILVMVRSDDKRITARIPKTIEGYPVKVEVTGEIQAY